MSSLSDEKKNTLFSVCDESSKETMKDLYLTPKKPMERNNSSSFMENEYARSFFDLQGTVRT